ncbi:glucose-6-phosphate exchanger SLC37A2 isoform X2 [Toxorhynchites rutilus septentrionalis]|uniref:glucose-6-phosphate exchanger SLC37A2 isoform X2 n=1 Tax=Toxorhynchites rutilus septentrionalis TaxID=329112 RepID=UPI002479997C|nr:glucose-6-phosphate exchanger SLC37A2 isoform X2 [Toxorhynchites rutilus septentrionalis]
MLQFWPGGRRIMSTSYPDAPLGVRLVTAITGKLCPQWQINRLLWFKCSVLGLTYLAYMCYHMTRKPISIVKAVLHRNCSQAQIPPEFVSNGDFPPNDSTWCDYPPFDGTDSAALLGTLDTSFLFCYAIAMFLSGFIAERVSIRYFLTFGMLLSGIFCYLFGVAKVYDIHSFMYFVFVQAMAGIFQTTGWPGVVTIVGRWFGKSKRGLIYGIWNSHTSIGNILGTLIAAYYVESDWSMSFIVPGFIMGVFGFVMFLFLVDRPEIVDCHEKVGDRRGSYRKMDDGRTGDAGNSDVEDPVATNSEQDINERTPIIGSINRTVPQEEAIGFKEALNIPGVVEFSFCLFFSKLVSYTFMYWLPLYIGFSTKMGAELSGKVSTLFDLGGIVGAIAAGMISDYSGMAATTCVGMLAAAAPTLLIYQQYGAVSLSFNILLLFIVGVLVNGPYALITTSVSAELGQHRSNGNSKALATVTAIIDGTGSIGAAIGPLLAGFVSSSGWENVFYMLIVSDLLALLLLLRLVSRELTRNSRRRNVRIE